MKYLKIFYLLLALLSFNNFHAQTPDKNSVLNDFHYLKAEAKPTGEVPYGITGSPYYKDDFQNGYLYFPDREPISAKVRYDVVEEEMQILFGPDDYRVLHDGIQVGMEDALFQKYSYRGTNKGESFLGYFKILTPDDEKTNNLLLLEKHFKEIKSAKKTARMQRAIPPKYVQTSDYYLKFNGTNSAVVVERKLKDFLNSFPDENREALQAFIKDNKLKLKKEQDLLTIVEYYNSRF